MGIVCRARSTRAPSDSRLASARGRCKPTHLWATRAARARAVTGLVAVGILAAACSVPSSSGGATTSPTTTSRSSTAAGVAARLEQAMDVFHGFSGTVLVARGDQVLLNKGYGLSDAASGTANGPTTRFRIGSITKQFTAAAILLLQQQGRLSVKDPICRYLPTCPHAWQAITIHQALTHTSGLPNSTDLPEINDARKPITPAQQLKLLGNLPLEFTPGSDFQYCNTGYLALGLVIEKVSGTSYEDFLQRAILKPVGMADSGYDTGDDGVAVGYTTGTTLAFPISMVVPYAAGALYSTAPDLLRWQLSLLAGTLLDASGTAAMTTPAVTTTDEPGLGYSYGIFVTLDPNHRVLIHEGDIDGFHSRLSHDTSNGVTVVLLTNHEDAPRLQHIDRLLTLTALR